MAVRHAQDEGIAGTRRARVFAVADVLDALHDVSLRLRIAVVPGISALARARCVVPSY